MTAIASNGVEEFAEAVTAMDPVAGRAVVSRLLAGGADPISVIDQVIVPSQRQVGLRWQRAEWTVAQQHAATEVALAGADVIRRHLGRVSVLPLGASDAAASRVGASGVAASHASAPQARRRGHVLLACAEREWHALPVTLIALAMRAAGWETTVLGAGVSPLRLGRYLHELGPDATAISCSVLASLPTSRRFIEASSAAGVPSLVGGAAFGAGARRAGALGATAWASSARGAVHAMDGLPLVVPPVPALRRDLATELATLREQHPSILIEAGARWRPFGDQPAAPRYPDSPGEVVRDCINQALHAVAAALITDDPSVLAETRSWVLAVLAARGDRRAEQHAAELGVLLGTIVREYPLSDALLAANW